MHLLYLDEEGSPRMATFPNKKPEYAILSHTWGNDDHEVTFQDILHGTGRDKPGFRKILGCGDRANQHRLKYFWIDSCCIDKSNKQEEAFAISSMFRWYQEAAECYVYLADVWYDSAEPVNNWEQAFRESRWFTRGWTLQELIAPKFVNFFSSTWWYLGDKMSLEQQIHEVTELPHQALQQHPLFTFNLTERRRWASKRTTKVEEDSAYCLQGIFNVTIEPRYGEGQAKAFERLEAAYWRPQMDYLEIKRWLAAPDPAENHTRARKLREPRTGSWYLESSQHVAIKAGLQNSVWLHGIPGSGKSVLCSNIIDNLLADTWADPKRVVAFFYFDFQDKQKRDALNMLRSLIEQLLSQSETVPSLLNNLYTECDKGRKQPVGEERYLDVLEQMVGMFDRVLVVLDALDECSNQEQLFALFQAMRAWPNANLALILTSRREHEIERALCIVEGASGTMVARQNAINLNSNLVDKDIERFVDVHFQRNYALARWKSDPDLFGRIKRGIVSGAKGMFRWAVCQLDVLARCRCIADVDKALITLPATLDETYERILMQIRDDDREYAIRMLRLLALSERTLLLEELVELLPFHGNGEQTFDRAQMFFRMEDLIEICRTLVTPTKEKCPAVRIFPYFEDGHGAFACNEELKTYERDLQAYERDSGISSRHRGMQPFEHGCRVMNEDKMARASQRKDGLILAHYTVKEYLLSTRCAQGPVHQYAVRLPEAYAALTRTLLQYLLAVNDGKPLSFENARDFKAMGYASTNWHRHARYAQDVPQVVQISLKLLDRSRGSYLNWLSFYAPSAGDSLIAINPRDPPGPHEFGNMWRAEPLYWASREGLTGVVGELLREVNVEVDAEGGFYGRALTAAAAMGNEAIVNLFIEARADVDGVDYDYPLPPLLQALEHEHIGIAEALILAGADVHLEDFNDRSAYDLIRKDKRLMGLAHSAGKTSISETLFREVEDDSYEDLDFVMELLEEGADLSFHDRIWSPAKEQWLDGNALEAAEQWGNEALADLLRTWFRLE